MTPKRWTESQKSFWKSSVRLEGAGLVPPSPSDLVPQELVQVQQLFGIGDLPVQRGIPLERTCGPANADGGVRVGPAVVLVRGVE